MKKTVIPIILILSMIFICQNAQNQLKKETDKSRIQSRYSKTTSAGYVPNAITVKLKAGTIDLQQLKGTIDLGIGTLNELCSRFNAYELDKRFHFNPTRIKAGMPDLSRIYRITFQGNHSIQEIVNAFSNDPNVEYAEPIPLNYPDEEPNDPMFDQCQHLPQIFAPSAWDIHKGEDGTEEVVVAIIDNGVYWKHQDLAQNIWQNLGEDADGDGVTMVFDGSEWIMDPDDINGIDDDGNAFTDDLIGWDFGMNNNDPDHNWGENHGTHCSGIAAGVTNNNNGIASISWNISTMPVQVAAESGTFNDGYSGIIYAAENGADAISNSWSSPTYAQANQEAITYAQQLGAVIFASAGNYNSTQLRYPASYTGVLSVAAVNVDDTKTAYSSFGPAVDISCPGGGFEGGILSTLPYDSYGPMSGTSMSCPMTAGSFGLLKSYHPDWTIEDLITQFLGSADDINILNPDHENLLGTGRVNAFRFLTEENIILPQVLKIDLISSSYTDENANLINEPGEEVMLQLEFRNYVPNVGEDNVTFTLTTEDPDITILQSSATVDIPPDGIFTVMDQFKFEVGNSAEAHFAEFKVTINSGMTIPWGQEHVLNVLVAPSGTFVFEGEPAGRDYSGTFICNILNQMDYEVVYSNTYPNTLRGFDNVFVSHGNFGQNLSEGTMFTEAHSLMFQDYLENGGNLFVDMGAMFGAVDYAAFSNNAEIKALFGVESNYNNMISNPLDSLYGGEGSPMEGIAFTQSNQIQNWYVDDLTLTDEGMATFYESNYGIVSCLSEGTETYGHKTFYLGYSLSELVDMDPLNSKNNVLIKVLDFFEMLEEGFILAGFSTDKQAGGVPLEVQFTNTSISEEGYPVTSWAWDFDSDGTIDSDEENPLWTFETSGNHTVTLIVTNEASSDTLVRENWITVNEGFLVYEGKEEGEGYSGTFIRDYMETNGFWSVTYTNTFPEDIRGYWAVFLSFGNYDSENTVLNDWISNVLIDYLLDGGFVYLEGGDALGFDQASNTDLLKLLGMESADDGIYNEIDSLAGMTGTLTDDLLFISTGQQALTYIDKYNPLNAAEVAFIESDYGTVGVQFVGEKEQRTFCFSYTLADLDDGEYPNTREELLRRICGFFDITTEMEEVVQGSRLKVQGYPNPASSLYSIEVSLEQPEEVVVQLYDLMGKSTANTIAQTMASGDRLQLDLSDLRPGIYFCNIRIGSETFTKKIIKN